MDSEQCMSDWSSMVLEQSFFNKANNGGILGIAKDGHLLVGPWNDSGELWQCDQHDICNGRFDSEGNYQYVATGTFPYHLGCWGPGDIQEYKPSCSASGCGTKGEGYTGEFGSSKGGKGGSGKYGRGGKYGKSGAFAIAQTTTAILLSMLYALW